jgi:hypothetical protein
LLKRIVGLRTEKSVGDYPLKSYITHNSRNTMKSRMRLAGHVACMGEMRNAQKVRVRKSEGKTPLKRLGIDGRLLLEQIFEK